MKLLYLGSGFVGACSAAIAANSGHETLVYDIDKEKISMLSSGDRDTIESCLFEKGLGDLLVRNKEHIQFTTDYDKAEEFLDNCDAVFMCLPTPEIGETGESDLSFYLFAFDKLCSSLVKRNNHSQEKYIVLVNKSTVPIETAKKSRSILFEKGVKNVGVVSNPEFLVEGRAVDGSMKPDRVVMGAENMRDFEIMRNVYRRFYGNTEVKYIEVNNTEAEAGKLLANYYLSQKLVSCFDVAGRTCEAFDDLGFENLRQIITSDKRIGTWGFYDSLYAGGSCFIKDARSLSYQLRSANKNDDLVDCVYAANKRQLSLFLSRYKSEAKKDWSGKKVAIFGLSFKRDTNDVRNAPSVEIVKFLFDNGVEEVRLSDPAAIDNFKKVLKESGKIKYFGNEHEFDAASGADIIIISADWPQYRSLADLFIANLQPGAVIMDGRRILYHRYEDLRSAGFDIIAVGSPFLPAKK